MVGNQNNSRSAAMSNRLIQWWEWPYGLPGWWIVQSNNGTSDLMDSASASSINSLKYAKEDLKGTIVPRDSSYRIPTVHDSSEKEDVIDNSNTDINALEGSDSYYAESSDKDTNAIEESTSVEDENSNYYYYYNNDYYYEYGNDGEHSEDENTGGGVRVLENNYDNEIYETTNDDGNSNNKQTRKKYSSRNVPSESSSQLSSSSDVRTIDSLSVLLWQASYDYCWFRTDRSGPYYTITAISTEYSNGQTHRSDNNIMYQGTLCSPRRSEVAAQNYAQVDSCAIILSPGIYKFRVTGALYARKRSVQWKFCNTVGGTQMELIFRILDTSDDSNDKHEHQEGRFNHTVHKRKRKKTASASQVITLFSIILALSN